MAAEDMKLITKAYEDVFKGVEDKNTGHMDNMEDGNNLDRMSSCTIVIEEDTKMIKDESENGGKDISQELESNKNKGSMEKERIEAATSPLKEGSMHAEEKRKEGTDLV